MQSIRESGVIVTSCSSRKDFFKVIGGLKRRPLADHYQVTVTDILEMVKESVRKSTLFKSTGGVHSASIFVDMSLRAFAEDVGRHNAVDKTIGICIENDIPLEQAILITSGRQTADIVIKAARCRIPISVSMRAPLSSGVYAAKLMGITLICFARGHRMNIYSTPKRIKSLY
jgi:FdhD protein